MTAEQKRLQRKLDDARVELDSALCEWEAACENKAQARARLLEVIAGRKAAFDKLAAAKEGE